MSVLTGLEPQSVWHYFEEITQIPRPSKYEEKIIDYLVNFAKTNSLECKRDDVGNVVILRAAAPTMLGRATVILQSHMDMVCEKNSDVEFDFMKDPINIELFDGWVGASGTTLGADCGIGMAAALALLADNSLELPAIEALFTVDEETGLTGAFGLGLDMLTGSYLINLDSEDEGELFIGCAGGVDTLATFTYDKESAPEGYIYYTLSVSGLKGGHSGDDINKGHANSNKVLAHLIRRFMRVTSVVLCDFNGGNLRNAIPREATVVFGVPSDCSCDIDDIFDNYLADITDEYGYVEQNLKMALSVTSPQNTVVTAKVATNLISSLVAVDNGVIAMSSSMPGLVETSSNLASVKFVDDDKIVVITSQRSSLAGSIDNAASTIESLFTLAGADVIHTDGYPGWNPNTKSRLLDISKESYKALFGVDPKVRAIHAGLECGLFLEKYPELDMISFGPTLRGVHSPDERLEISTVDKFWKLLVSVLQNI